MSLPMRVKFDNTAKNWQLWGQLVESWICGIVPLPKEVAGLVKQGSERGITDFSVPGSQDRNVKFYWDDEPDELPIWLPSEEMLKAARNDVPPGQYPLPAFYDEVYAGPRRDLTADQETLFAGCRVGEYTINNCA
jgi:hypothetical protein